MSENEKQKSAVVTPVWQSACHDLVEVEIGRLVQEHVYVMAENEDYVVIRAMADQIPYALYEIGRLREITAVERRAEGTGRIVDLDHFDLYYIHIVVWNRKRREIAASCRLGQMDIILKRFGMNGLHSGTVFRYSPLFQQEIGPALEIGKVFVRPEYGHQYMPVSILWRAVGRFLSYNPHYRMLVGLFFMSERYSSLSHRAVASFLKMSCFAPGIARLVEPIASGPRRGRVGGARVMRTPLKDLAALTNLISEIEPDGKGIPDDIRHFVKSGGKLIGFGGHPSSKNACFGLVLLDLARCSRGVLNHCMGGPGLERFFDHHEVRKDRAA